MRAAPNLVPAVSIALSAFILANCTGSEVGLIANEGQDRVSAFDPASDMLQGSVPIARSSTQHYEMAISPLAQAGYIAATGSSKIRTVSLDNLPPNVITTFQATHSVSDMATFPADRALLLMAGGRDSGQAVISTITANGNEIDRMVLGRKMRPVAMTGCDDQQSLLVGLPTNPPEVHKFSIASDGSISTTGNTYTLQVGTALADVICAPGSVTATAVTNALQATSASSAPSAYVESFSLGNMSGQHVETLTGRHPISAVFSPNGQTIFAHSGLNTRFGESYIDSFTYDPAQGTFGSGNSITAPAVGAAGRSTLAMNETGSKLYAPDQNTDRLVIFDPGTLSVTGSVSGNLDFPVSIVTAGR